jgi:hypothetical protein
LGNKLKFEIDDINLIEEVSDGQLAIAEVWVCNTGMNLHEKPISIETLKEAAPTLLNKFLICAFDGRDFEGHEYDQQIVGFFPKENNIKFVEKNGKIYLVANAIISKIYADWAYDVFTNKDNNYRSVSMEITVLKTEIKSDGYEWITKFVFNAVTILGKKHIPACEGSNVQIVKFSKENIDEYEKLYHEKLLAFGKYDDLDFKIPSGVKSSAKRGLELRKELGRGGTSVGLSTARYLINNETATPEKVRHIAKYFPRHMGDNLDENGKNGKDISNGYIAYCLWGGDAGRRWSTKLVEAMNKRDEERMSYFTENKSMENQVIEVDGDNLTTHIQSVQSEFEKIKQGDLSKESINHIKSYCNKLGLNMNNFSEFGISEEDYETYFKEEGETMEENKTEEMSVETPVEKMEEQSEEMKCASEEENKGDAPNEDSKEKPTEEMSSNEYVDNGAMQELNDKSAEDNKELSNDNLSVEDDKDKIIAGLKEEMSAMQVKMSDMEEKMSVYMSENETLKKFKSDIEDQKKQFEVDTTLKDVMNILPKEEFEACQKSAENFSLENIQAWKNEVQAKAFKFSKGITEKEPFIRVDIPQEQPKKASSSLWD